MGVAPFKWVYFPTLFPLPLKENQRLRDLAASYEERLETTEREIEGLRANLSQTEDRLNDYRDESEKQWKHIQVLSIKQRVSFFLSCIPLPLGVVSAHFGRVKPLL